MHVSVLWAVCRVRAPELREACPRRPRDGPVLVRGVVPRLAYAPGAAARPLAGPGPPHLVGARGLAPARPAPGRRGPPRCIPCERSVTTRGRRPVKATYLPESRKNRS